MATADKGPEERKQEREANLLGRDKASNDTTGFIAKHVASVEDDNVAQALAAINQQLNDVEPPDQKPFKWFHRELSIDIVSVLASGEVELNISDLKGYELPANVHVRFSEVSDSIDTTVIETDPVSVDSVGTLTITTNSLNQATEYNVRGVVEANHQTGSDAAFSETTTVTTE